MNKSLLLKIFIAFLVLSASALFLYKDYLSTKETSDTEGSDLATTTATGKVNISDVEVKPAPVKNTISEEFSDRSTILKIMPDINKKWVMPDSYNKETKDILERRIADLNAILKSDYEHYDKWIDLGVLRKVVGDYDEARNIWEFSAQVWPDSLVAFHNLGDLYHFYLKDYAKAEVNMLKVIEIDPHYFSEYGLIYDLYKRLYGMADQRTVGILIKGLNSNPDAVDLMMLTAGHYKDAGDRTNARKYYEMALVQAKKLNDTNLQGLINGELNSL